MLLRLLTPTLLLISFSLYWGVAYGQSSYGERRSYAKEHQLLYGRLPVYRPPEPMRYPSELYREGISVQFSTTPFQFENSISSFLSTACAQGLFNQRQINGYVVPIKDYNKADKIVGFASSRGINLRDPKKYAREGLFYLFDLDGTSSCKVAVFQE